MGKINGRVIEGDDESNGYREIGWDRGNNEGDSERDDHSMEERDGIVVRNGGGKEDR